MNVLGGAIPLQLTIGFLLFTFLLDYATCSINPQSARHKKLSQFQSSLQQKLSSTKPITPSQQQTQDPTNKKQDGRVIYPIGYGADPTGIQDSTDAILKAVADAFQVQKGLELLPGINDLGGVIIDFQGGNYNISAPITFPSGSGNVVVQGGSLRASDKFPDDRHLVELSPSNSNSKPQKRISYSFTADMKAQNADITYEDITFRDILFDSNFHGGGIYVSNSARIRITNCYFVHFTTQGILVRGGHETFISNSFLGQIETVGGDSREKDFSGTAIDLASNDNAVTDVAIFSAAIGVVLRGQANLLTGIHCYNKATYFGGIGILVKLPGNSQARIDNCYLDYNSIVLEDPTQVHVTNGFFLGDGNVVLKSVNGQASGVTIVNNMFSGNPKNMKPIVELDGEFKKLDQVVIDNNNAIGMGLRSTVGRLTVAGEGQTWTADFSPILLFPNRIVHLQYSFYNKQGSSGAAAGGAVFVGRAVTNVSNNAVTVESDRKVDGLVSVYVDQNSVPGEQGII